MKKHGQFSDSQTYFACPVCQETLSLDQQSLVCPARHSFDLSKFGYVNLLLKHKKEAPYDKASFINRQQILQAGYYDHILQAIGQQLAQLSQAKSFLDTACGEGFYAKHLQERLGQTWLAFDLSKDSIQLAAKQDRVKQIKWFVGDLAQLPLQAASIDVILNCFAPANYGEFQRVLTDNGYLLKVIPGKNHLIEFRQVLAGQSQGQDYSNQAVLDHFKEQFDLLGQEKVSQTFQMPSQDLEIFSEMTPLFFNVDKTKLDLSSVSTLTVEAELVLGRKKADG